MTVGSRETGPRDGLQGITSQFLLEAAVVEAIDPHWYLIKAGVPTSQLPVLWADALYLSGTGSNFPVYSGL